MHISMERTISVTGKIRSYLLAREYPALRDLSLLLTVFGSAFFLLLGRVGLFEPDEGRYAEIPREMLARGDWVTPTLNYVAYFEKPPLHYWLNAISFTLFGQNEFAARFAGALAGLLCVLLVYHTGRTLFGRREGLFSALVLGSSTGFLAQARINLTDMTLTFCLTASLCCYLIARRDHERHKGRYYTLFYLFAALAVLAKGLIGLVFPAGIIFCHLAVTRRWRRLREMHLAGGMALLLATVAPWFVLVSWRNPEFARFFFIHEHLERFLTTVHERYQPFWYFVPILLLTMFPWSFYAVRAVARAWRERQRPRGEQVLFLLIWAALIFLFFSASHSKLIPYILPVFPPLALLLGTMFSDQADLEEKVRAHTPEAAALVVLFAIAALLAIAYPRVRDLAPLLTGSGLVRPGSSLLTRTPLLSPAGGIIMAVLTTLMGVTTWLASRRRDMVLLFAGLCLGSFFLETMGLPLFLNGIELNKSSRELSLLAGEVAAPDACLASFGYEQSLPFYTTRRVVVIGGRGELEFGSKLGNQAEWFIEEPDFIRQWQGKRQMVVLLRKADYERVAPRLIPAATVLGQKGKRMLICNFIAQK